MQPIQAGKPVVKTWKPVVAGVLDIIEGVFGVLGCIGFIIISIVFSLNANQPGFTDYDLDPLTASSAATLFLVIAIILAIMSVLAIVGGIFAVRRKKWGFALAGSIAAAIPGSILGILAVIFVGMSKNEFD